MIDELKEIVEYIANGMPTWAYVLVGCAAYNTKKGKGTLYMLKQEQY